MIMKAIQIEAYGDENVLNYTDVDRPEPKGNEILVKIKAAAVNPVDIKIRNGKGKTFGMELPLILGADFAGTVEQIGSAIKKFNTGDAVYGKILIGCYAEYVIVKETELGSKPENLDFIKAASLPMATLTAWQAIFDNGHLTKGQRILVHGASGSVGSMAVQLAKAKGAYVIGTASAQNEDFVKNLGVDEFIDYKSEDFETLVKDLDVVFDPIGGDTHKRSYQVLKENGFLVSLVQEPSAELIKQYQVQAKIMASQPNPEQLEKITQMVERGQIKTDVAKVLPLSEAKEAQKLSQDGNVRGKIILEPKPY